MRFVIRLTCVLLVFKPDTSLNCDQADWSISLDTTGWSVCPKTNTYLKGLWRNDRQLGDERIGRIEFGRCCPASESAYTNQPAVCENANWVITLDGFNVWALCPNGYFLNGFRVSGQKLFNIEEGKCCRPQNQQEDSYDGCYDEDVLISFDNKGWSVCKKEGYYMVGLYKSVCNELYCIETFKCCRMKYRAPTGSVTCNDGHTVSITISNVDDYDEWTAADWQLEGSDSCEPTLNSGTVTYSSLSLPDCAESSEQHEDGIKYILKINPTVTNKLQSRSYEHLYYVSCKYDNDDNAVASFVPIKDRTVNNGTTLTPREPSSFTFSLGAFPRPDFTGTLPNTLALGQTLYFKAWVTTPSNASNLDILPLSCWASKSKSGDSTDGKIQLIDKGCGNSNPELSNSLSYTCADDSTEETFSITTFRYVGSSSAVYFHCKFKVCLAIFVSDCDCPKVCGENRKRRSLDESEVYHVTAGPFIFKSVEEDEKEDDMNKEEGCDKQDDSQSFSTNLATVVAVSGVVITAIVCATIYLFVRNRRQRNDLSSSLTELTASSLLHRN
ncbi:hypothetical protein ACROYT_G039788 [Oculina patagonica]